MRRLVLALVALVIPLGSWGPYVFSGGGEGAPPCEGLCMRFTDTFNDGDIDGWTTVGTSDVACVIEPTFLDSLRASNTHCKYDGIGDGGTGAQPTDDDEWGAFVYKNNSDANGGISLRRKTNADMTNTEYYFALRQGLVNFDFRVCDGDNGSGGENDCQTFEDEAHSETADAGDGIIFAVAGTGASAEFAAWFVDDADETFDVCDPSAWNDADLCVSADGTIDEAKLTAHCDCPTKCSAWDNDPTDETDKDHPAAGQFDVGYYVGSSSTPEADKICGGTL